MTKRIVNVFSDENLQFTIAAEHPWNDMVFNDDWDACLEQCRQWRPQEWQVEDIEKLMKKLGWKLKAAMTLEVAY